MEKKRNTNSKNSEQEIACPAASWHCDTYCRKIRHTSCEGEGRIDENATQLCPYFEEMLY